MKFENISRYHSENFLKLFFPDQTLETIFFKIFQYSLLVNVFSKTFHLLWKLRDNAAQLTGLLFTVFKSNYVFYFLDLLSQIIFWEIFSFFASFFKVIRVDYNCQCFMTNLTCSLDGISSPESLIEVLFWLFVVNFSFVYVRIIFFRNFEHKDATTLLTKIKFQSIKKLWDFNKSHLKLVNRSL